MQQGFQPITPEEVVNTAFSVTRFRAGYDQDQVDDHLDAIVVALRAHLDGDVTDDDPRAEQVAGIAFQVTRWRDGYDQHEVDALLDRARRTLEWYESR